MMMGNELYLQEGHQANPGSETVAGPLSLGIRHCLCLRVIETLRDAISTLLQPQLPPRGTIGHSLL